ALQHRGAHRAGEGRAAPGERRRPRRAQAVLRRPRARRGHPRGLARRPPHRADAHRVQTAPLPAGQRPARPHPRPDPRARVGLHLRRQRQRARDLHLLPAPQDRRRRRRHAVDPHRPRRRLHASGSALNGADVEIVIPVYNEEAQLDTSVRRLHAYLDAHFPLTWRITVADNASRDRTWGIADRLAATLDGVHAIRLARKGRGRALRSAWSDSTAHVLAYMDVDLSTDLDALLPLVAPLVSGHSDVAIGTRLAHGSRVVHG